MTTEELDYAQNNSKTSAKKTKLAHGQKVKGVVNKLDIPVGEVVIVHVRLKGMTGSGSYTATSKLLIEELLTTYNPKTVLIPTFTYKFTEHGKYDRLATPSEVGRFGEEVRKLYPKRRTMNPVFSFVDVNDYLCSIEYDDTIAFGRGSLLSRLSDRGFVQVNINLDKFVSTHLHYVEKANGVGYRYDKVFTGRVSSNGEEFRDIEYKYHVRKLNMDTKWRREKIKKILDEEGVLYKSCFQGVRSNWIYSDDLEQVIGSKLDENPRFLVEDIG